MCSSDLKAADGIGGHHSLDGDRNHSHECTITTPTTNQAVASGDPMHQDGGGCPNHRVKVFTQEAKLCRSPAEAGVPHLKETVEAVLSFYHHKIQKNKLEGNDKASLFIQPASSNHFDWPLCMPIINSWYRTHSLQTAH